MLFDIVWDDRHCDEARLRAASRLVGPQAAYIWQNGLVPFRYLAKRLDAVSPTSFPVVIGAGSHPFPFRTRKLSLPPPMVLRAKVRGRVGRCRE